MKKNWSNKSIIMVPWNWPVGLNITLTKHTAVNNGCYDVLENKIECQISISIENFLISRNQYRVYCNFPYERFLKYKCHEIWDTTTPIIRTESLLRVLPI